jgi:hypothetical protein
MLINVSPFEGGNLWLQQYWQFFGMTSEASLGSTVHCKSGRAKGGLWQVQTWCWINHVWTLNYVFVCQQTGLVDWWHTSQVHRAPYLYVLPVVFKLLLRMRLHWFGCLVLIWTSVGKFSVSVCVAICRYLQNMPGRQRQRHSYAELMGVLDSIDLLVCASADSQY